MKKRNLKLLTMVLALALSVTAIVGSTVAYFTDTASTEEEVMPGNLDVTLEYYDPDAAEWVTVQEKDLDPSEYPNEEEEDTSANLFKDDARYEPGYTEYAMVRVTNVGDLALKYKLGVKAMNTKAGTNVYGNTYYLSDYLMVGTEQTETAPTSRADVWENYDGKYITGVDDGTTTIDELYNVVLADGIELQPGEENAEIYAVALWMPTSVGNEANYKTGTDDEGNSYKPTIALGVTLEAIQLTSESDSFSNDYDEGATFSGSESSDEEGEGGGNSGGSSDDGEESQQIPVATDGDFTYYVDVVNNVAGVQYYNGSSTTPTVPATMTYNGTSYPVTATYHNGAFKDVTEVSLPASMTSFGNNSFRAGVTLNLAENTNMREITETAFTKNVYDSQGINDPLVTINYAGSYASWQATDTPATLAKAGYVEGEDYILKTTDNYTSAAMAVVYTISTNPDGADFEDWVFELETDSYGYSNQSSYPHTMALADSVTAEVVTLPSPTMQVIYNSENSTLSKNTTWSADDSNDYLCWYTRALVGPIDAKEVQLPANNTIARIANGTFTLSDADDFALVLPNGQAFNFLPKKADGESLFGSETGDGMFKIIYQGNESGWRSNYGKCFTDAGYVEGVDYIVLFKVADTEDTSITSVNGYDATYSYVGTKLTSSAS